jgi:hypothetical protein
VLGTILLSVLSGHWRYAHINALRGDGINPELLGMTRVASEDSVRRGIKGMDEAESGQWLKRHLQASYEPLLVEPWVLDVDTTVKPLYGHQWDAVVGYNPNKPGRPSHAYHSYFIAQIRVVLDMEVQAGNQTASSFAQPELWAFGDGLAERNRPIFIRGDCHWGTEKAMLGAEERGIGYLFKLKQSANVEEVDRSNLQQRGMGGGGATMAGEGGRTAVERMDEGAAGGGVAEAVTEQSSR